MIMFINSHPIINEPIHHFFFLSNFKHVTCNSLFNTVSLPSFLITGCVILQIRD